MNGVNNLITIKPKVAPTQIQTKIEAALVRDVSLDAENIRVKATEAPSLYPGWSGPGGIRRGRVNSLGRAGGFTGCKPVDHFGLKSVVELRRRRKAYENRRKNETVVVYVASYASLDDANADYAAVKQLYRDGVIGVYDAAVVSKDADGRVKIDATEKPTQYGALSGLAVGALVGIFFPPYLVWELATGAVIGSLIGHFWRECRTPSEADRGHAPGEHGNPDCGRQVEAAQGSDRCG